MLEVAIGSGQPGLERPVDEQAPHLLERDLAHELFDVDAAVAELSALAIRLGDLRFEGDDSCEAWAELVHA